MLRAHSPSCLVGLDKDVAVLEQDGLDGLALEAHVGEEHGTTGAGTGHLRLVGRAQQRGPKHDREVVRRHLIVGLVGSDAVEVRHEEAQRGIVGVGQVVDLLVQADLAQKVVADLGCLDKGWV